MNDLSKLAPECEATARHFLKLLTDAGLAYYVCETLRTEAAQVAYYAQGRKHLSEVNRLRAIAGLPGITEGDNGNTITKCDGVKIKSPHQSGRALDVYPVLSGRTQWAVTDISARAWLQMGAISESAGLEWGGRWTPLDRWGIGWDACHFEMKADA